MARALTLGVEVDGDLMEGVAAEAASLAGTLRLGRLLVLYDANLITSHLQRMSAPVSKPMGGTIVHRQCDGRAPQ
jgi:hypothetical protein